MTDQIVKDAAIEWWEEYPIDQHMPIEPDHVLESFQAGVDWKTAQLKRQQENDRVFNTGMQQLDDLLMEAYWLGQGDGGHDAGMMFLEKLEAVQKLIIGGGQGPDQFYTWKDAAIAERVRRVNAEHDTTKLIDSIADEIYDLRLYASPEEPIGWGQIHEILTRRLNSD